MSPQPHSTQITITVSVKKHNTYFMFTFYYLLVSLTPIPHEPQSERKNFDDVKIESKTVCRDLGKSGHNVPAWILLQTQTT